MGAEANPAAMKLDANPMDRRERRPVSLRGLAIRADASTAEIYLLDLSYEGCGSETPIELEAGDAITRSVLRRGAIDAHVRWYRDGRAGLVFDAQESSRSAQQARRSERIVLSAEVSLRRLGHNSYRVKVTDLSPEGCKVDLVERPRIGEHMLLKLAGLEVLDAETCWIEDYVAGLRFEKPIHPAVFDLLLDRLK